MPKPIVASYCSTFLKPEMLHIYRQVTGLQRYETFVIAKDRQCEEKYPFAELEIQPRAPRNFARRFYYKYILKLPPLYYRGELRVIHEILERRYTDLMHVYFGHTGVHLLPFIKNWDRPTVVSFHGADVMLRPEKPDYAPQLQELFNTVSLVLARSNSLACRLKEIGCPAEKIRLNRTGIPLAEFPFTHRLMPADGEWRLVQACRLIPKKGLATALEAFASFRKKHPKATFTIAGDGPMRKELEELAVKLGVGDAVTFRGFLQSAELNALYAQSHVFLHPSEITEDANQEGIPNSMLEAMATGLPVVATLHGGIPEAVEQERSGLLVPERDPVALAAALEQITESSEYLQIMGRRASESVCEEFEQSRAIKKLEACYDEALSFRGRTHTAVSR
jgi:colanic acid/amylovoran biosynthesis glycosyltransferase